LAEVRTSEPTAFPAKEDIAFLAQLVNAEHVADWGEWLQERALATASLDDVAFLL
jgi:hypothetical protein